jgi:phosphate-selective porin
MMCDEDHPARRALALFVLLLLFAAPLFGQSIEERLAKLEQEVRELRAENQELRKQLPAAPAPEAKPVVAEAKPAAHAAPPQEVKPAGKETKLLVGGFIQAQAESGDRVDTRYGDDNDRVFLRRARVNVQGSFAEKFDFKAELDLGGGLGSASGVRAQGTDLYAQWSRHPSAQIRAGQFKTPYGYEQIFSDTKVLPIERSLGSDRIALGRQVGVQLFGDSKKVSYAVGAFNGNGTNASFNDDEGFLAAGRVSTTLWSRGESHRWTAGANGYTSEDRSAPVAPELGFASNTFAGTRRAWGVDTQLLAGPLEVWGEVLHARFDPNSGATRDLDSWYVVGGYAITKKLQAVAMFDTLDGPGNAVRTWTAGANYFIKGHDLKLQLNLMRTDDDKTRVSARFQTLF